MYASKTPKFLKAISSDLVWNKSRDEKNVYLTFDDGPTPKVTNQVLDLLSEYNAKATFFCVGDMILKSPSLFQRIKDENHAVGNHTMKHESGWKSSNISYFKSFLECQKLTKTNLFRPPYGRISRSQSKAIKKRNDIIMWDVLPGDFDLNTTAETCVQRIIKNTQNGSIIVLHDSAKCGDKVLTILPEILEWLTNHNYSLQSL